MTKPGLCPCCLVAPIRVCRVSLGNGTGTIWSQRATSGPAPRAYHSLVYDTFTQRVVVHAGYGNSEINDTWAWDGQNWALLDSGGPLAQYHTMAYDTWRQRILLVGGLGCGGYIDTVWSRPSVTPTCDADLDDGSGLGRPDGGVSIEDLLYFLRCFEQGLQGANISGGATPGDLDCGVSIEDLLHFLSRFEAGC